MSGAHITGADVLGLGVLRPGAQPVLNPAPPAAAKGDWPAYRLEARPGEDVIPRVKLKRLGRAQAMALTVVHHALEGCGQGVAEEQGLVGVCVGTAWAEFKHELAFLENMIRRGEIGARPAFFANSVHNALASKIAMEYGWQGENHTFTHDELSFESALWQGLKLLSTGRASRAVVCGVDGLTDFLEMRGHLLGLYHDDPSPLAPLDRGGELRGTIPGEGAAAFVLAPAGAATAPLGRVIGVLSRGGPSSQGSVDANKQQRFILQALHSMAVDPGSVDAVLLGANGDAPLDRLYGEVLSLVRPSLGQGCWAGVYRHLVGDYATASALGLALALRLISERSMPPEVRAIGPDPTCPAGRVLLYHLSGAGHHTAMVVSST